MTEKFAIFLDVDGTLADADGINQKNVISIKKAQELGHYVFINTGRAKSWIDSKLLGGVSFDGVISGMGSLIEIAGTPIFEKHIDPDFVYSCAKHFWNTKNCFFISGVQKGFILNPIPYFKDWPFADIDSPEDLKGRYKDEKIQKIEIFGKDISEEDKNFLASQLDVYDHGYYIEAAPKGCTKSGAIDIVCRHLGIAKSHSIAIGDSVNDLDMLKNVGIAVAVGNALPSVKEIADFISTDCKSGGVGYAIEEILLKNNYKHFV